MDGGVILITARGCASCARAKEELAQAGISYRELDANTPEGMAEFHMYSNGSELPLLVWRGAGYVSVDTLIEAMAEK